MNRITLFSLFVLFMISCSNRQEKKNQISIFAASSVTNVARELAHDFERSSGIKVKLNIASSGILARQIESGALFDYYISANQNWMKYVDSLSLVNKHSIRNLASNQLVAIVPFTDQRAISENDFLMQFPSLFSGRLSIGDPKHVPAGKYAMQAIDYYEWDEELGNRILPAKNVRDALLMVELGEAEMGIVYQTDAKKSAKVNIVYTFPYHACDSIHYMGAASKSKSESLDQFLLYLQSIEAKQIWNKNGFKP
jgi:molybdate transport system substrate-binding protein